jgi:hypothetical protein
MPGGGQSPTPGPIDGGAGTGVGVPLNPLLSYFGLVEPSATITNTGTIVGAKGAIFGAASIVNTGLIGGSVGVIGYGSIDNQAGGVIVAFFGAIWNTPVLTDTPYGFNGGVHISNAGTIASVRPLHNPALYHPLLSAVSRLSVTNAAGGLIDSAYQGIAAATPNGIGVQCRLAS